MDLLVKNAYVVSPADGFDGQLDILISDGKIAYDGYVENPKPIKDIVW